MKIISTAEYNRLKKIEENSEREDFRVQHRDEKISELKDEISSLKKNHKLEVEDLNIELTRKGNDVENQIFEKTKGLKEQVAKLTAEKNDAVNKNEMYEKAFKNLGFDVKDMKNILDKLVQGIVAKNEVKVIKG